jgi:hypothetical protein
MVGLSLARNTNLVDASDLTNKTVERDERRSYHIYGKIMVRNLVPTNPSLRLFDLYMSLLSRRILMHTLIYKGL